ncbi:autotransporter outer membrane beta-barrel domain-containing protein [Yersinia enterocolitica]|uniref:autotransporter outer membrane beta-barrel domain-containing protein n=1 Tax=Yersinia enterocolitica TaxID=630 RepID=UPI0021E840B4|nr:autotransporter outer membrane beta-barrel domain-containing protein [Yersinia enterocolitica]EKN3946468.1 autotransporter outer membrane beta-barrel domain-containing protein [Yersinia enterocolitica]UYJ96405.1 autotransporter outer membrane beta-barrel domain-containing protein [Yersinia enterocolitica]
MNHRNTLNTRLLPLSILISSLVSGGVMAASTPTFTPGATLGMGNGGSFIVATNTVVNTKAPEDILLGSLFLEDQAITAEMIKQAESQIVTMRQNHQKQAQDIKASIANLTAAQQKIAQKELDSLKVIFDKEIKQFEAAIDYAKTPNEDNKNKLHTATQDAFVTTINAQAPGLFTAEEANSLFNSALTKDNSAISLELQKKFAEVKLQQQANEEALNKFQDALSKDLITSEQKDKLVAYFAEKQAKFNELAVAKQEHKEAEEAATKASVDVVRLTPQLKFNQAKLKLADKEKIAAQTELSTLDSNKTTAITAVDQSWNANTPDLDKKLQELIDNPNTLQDKIKEAKEAQEAITKANTAKLLVNDATTKHQAAETAVKTVENEFADADNAKKNAASTLATKAQEMQAAEAIVAKLTTQADPTVDIPAFEHTITNAKQQTVAAGTFALDTQVSGGTQDVEKGGEIIGSIISEDGTVNLALGALANSTVITKGTMQNNSGTDKNTVVGAEGVLALKGASKTELAESEGAVIAKGGQVTAGAYSYITDMVSEGEITATDGAIISKAIIKGGNFTLQNKALAMNTALNDGTFTVETGAGAIGTTVNGGQFIVKDGVTVQHTELNNSQFDLKANATAEHTTVNKGATFIVSGEGVATDTKVNGGIFELKSKMLAMRLEVDDGLALIGSALQDLTLNGGITVFNKAAEITGTIEAKKDSFLSVRDGAKTESADLNLAGNMVLVAEDAPQIALHRSSRAAFNGINGKPANFIFKDVKLDGGSIDMSQTNAQLTMQSLDGKGSFNLGSALYNHATAPLNVTGDANGDFDVQINDSGVAPANLNIVDVKGVNTARFALSNGPVNLGNYKHNLVDYGNGIFKLVADTTALTPGAAGILAVANTTPTIFNAELSSIQNRLDKQSASANESGVWLTYLNDNYDVKGTATNFKQKLNGMTLGGDKAMELGEAVFSIGAFASHSSSNIKSDYQSSGSVESNSLGAYAQYLANSGYYLNGVMKTNQFKQNLNVTAKGSNASGNANFSGLGLAVKAGKHITIDELYVSPFVVMSSFTSGKSQYQLSNGMEAQSQGARTTTGTIGMNTGYRFVLNSGAEIKPYAIFSVDHDLMAKNDVVINNEMFDNSLKGTRANAGVGVNVNLTSNLSVGSEVKVSKGKNIATPMTINMGVAYTF